MLEIKEYKMIELQMEKDSQITAQLSSDYNMSDK